MASANAIARTGPHDCWEPRVDVPGHGHCDRRAALRARRGDVLTPRVRRQRAEATGVRASLAFSAIR